jgi:hypothetical protein
LHACGFQHKIVIAKRPWVNFRIRQERLGQRCAALEHFRPRTFGRVFRLDNATSRQEWRTIMKIDINSGAAIAAAAAVMLIAGVAVSAPLQMAAGEKGHCMGANGCEGKSACKTATNGCAGQNKCKGKGYTETTKEECEKIPDTTFEPAKT